MVVLYAFIEQRTIARDSSECKYNLLTNFLNLFSRLISNKSLKALCFLTSHSVSVFQTLIDKIGLDPILDYLSSTNSRVLQSILTMLAMYINDMNLKNISEKVINLILPNLKALYAEQHKGRNMVGL
jgi:hypothetical protein